MMGVLHTIIVAVGVFYAALVLPIIAYALYSSVRGVWQNLRSTHNNQQPLSNTDGTQHAASDGQHAASGMSPRHHTVCSPKRVQVTSLTWSGDAAAGDKRVSPLPSSLAPSPTASPPLERVIRVSPSRSTSRKLSLLSGTLRSSRDWSALSPSARNVTHQSRGELEYSDSDSGGGARHHHDSDSDADLHELEQYFMSSTAAVPLPSLPLAPPSERRRDSPSADCNSQSSSSGSTSGVDSALAVSVLPSAPTSPEYEPLGSGCGAASGRYAALFADDALSLPPPSQSPRSRHAAATVGATSSRAHSRRTFSVPVAPSPFPSSSAVAMPYNSHLASADKRPLRLAPFSPPRHLL